MSMKPLHAVICMVNSKYIHSALAPWYLLAGVRAYCYRDITAEVVEGTINQDVSAVAEALIAKRPDVVGFCCYIWNIAFLKKLIPLVKSALPHVVIVLGGPEVSYNADELLIDQPLVDFVLSGEGEKPFALLLNTLYDGGDPADLPGVCYRREGVPVVKPPHWTMEEPPDPYSDLYFQALKGRIVYIETSRGCPYACAFCLSGAGQSVRWFSLVRAKRDIVRLASSGTQTVKFVDRTFNADRARAREIFKFIADNYGGLLPAGVCFHFEIAGDLLDEETLSLLETMPQAAVQFEIGLQSFNTQTLEAINRKTDVAHLQQNIQRLVSMGNSHIHIDLIAGLPYEDLKSFIESFHSAYKLRPHMLQLGFLKLLHGAAMREEPGRYPCTFSPQPPYEVKQTPWLSPDELHELHELESALDKLYNSGRFRRTLDYVLTVSGLTAFELYRIAGKALHPATSVSLDALTALILKTLKALPGVDEDALRDMLVRDRLATNASGKLPPVLENQKAPRKLTGRGSGAALVCGGRVLVRVVDGIRDPVTGEFKLTETPL